jgi:multicomponent Na+:H+ antiporter subunit A
MLLGPLILGLLGLAFGLMPHLAAQWLVEPAVAAVLGAPDTGGRLKLWAGFNEALMLSLATFALGAILYWKHHALRRALAWIEARGPDFDAGWDRLMTGLVTLAEWQTRLIQTGVLRHYLFATFAVLALALGVPLAMHGAFAPHAVLPEFTLREVVVVALIVTGSLLTAFTGSRITAIAALGTVGIGVAMIFIIYGAPDVAITQLLVEMLVVVMFAVAALRMPFLDFPEGSRRFRPANAALAVTVGAIVAAITLMVTTGPVDRNLTTYFENTSWTEAYGRNIVNVILVDFRAIDTFGEIAVVIIAALGAFALLKGMPGRDSK